MNLNHWGRNDIFGDLIEIGVDVINSQVKEEIHHVFEACGTPEGGISACGEAGPDVPLANIRAMYEAFREYGTYR